MMRRIGPNVRKFASMRVFAAIRESLTSGTATGDVVPEGVTESVTQGVTVDEWRQLDGRVKALEDDVAKMTRTLRGLDFLCSISPKHVADIYPYMGASTSQNRQDIFVLAELDLKRNGFFVEFGAANGIDVSNTYLLESAFGWTGILSEPAKSMYSTLCKNRTSIVDPRCVWTRTGDKLQFCEAKVVEMSGIKAYMHDTDSYWMTGDPGSTYDVETVSLNDLLAQHNAPPVIDFLSIDTEGSEFDILNSFDFGVHDIRVIVCEHNYKPARDSIYGLLTSKGYKRKFEQFSRWDDWYVR